MKLLILRELSSADLRALKGHKLLICPAIQIKRKKYKLPQGAFDYGLVTSAHALQFVKRLPKVKTWIAIGPKSASGVRSLRRQVISDSNSAGVLKYFKKKPRGRIFFPRSHLGDPQLVLGLKRMGFKVSVVHTYTTRILRIRKPLLRLLRAGAPDAIFLTSPSSFEAIRKSLTRREIFSLSSKWVAIGPTTAGALKKFGLKKVRVAKQASIEAMLRDVRGLCCRIDRADQFLNPILSLE